jgi:EsV-1-7 cysteine-rich motif
MFIQVSITPDQPMRQGKQRTQKHPMCQDPACTGTQASYGYEQDKKLIRCAKHIEEGMIYLRAKQCEDPTCSKRASFGQPDTKVSDAQTACVACC